MNFNTITIILDTAKSLVVNYFLYFLVLYDFPYQNLVLVRYGFGGKYQYFANSPAFLPTSETAHPAVKAT